MRHAFVLSFLCFCLSSFSQVDTAQPPYKRFPALPPVQLLLSDSTTVFIKNDIPKKMPVLVMLFSPDCSHCQHTAEELVKNKEELKDIYVVMSTVHSVSQMNAFVTAYNLKELPNLTVGKDIYFLLPPFYGIRNFPFMAFYNKKGNFISAFEGSMPVAKMIALLKENK